MEKITDAVLPRGVFLLRMAKYVLFASVLASISLVAGMVGYATFDNQRWPEAFLNAAMILSAMGPVGEPKTDAGKVFAGCYALYCGLVFLFTAGLLVTPVAHRMLHVFHADPDED